jgi:hypothetical protein
MIVYKEFDSEVLGMKVGEVVNISLEVLNEDDYDYLFARIPVSDVLSINRLECLGFHTVEIYFEFARTTKDINSRYINTRLAKERDLDKILSITKEAFTLDRLHSDYSIPDELADKFYEQWITNAITKKYGDAVFVNSSVTGFSCCRISGGTGYIDLTALSGLSTATDLINADLTFFKDSGCELARTGTQATNTASISSLLRTGFKHTGTLVTLSKRITDNGLPKIN